MVYDVNCLGSFDRPALTGPACSSSAEGSADTLPAGFQQDENSSGGDIVLLLLAIGERLRQHLAAVGARHDLTPQQAMLLERLTNRKSMGQLAEELACDKSNITGLVSRLEVRGLIARMADEHDRRVRWLTLSNEGRALRDQLRDEVIQEEDVLLAGFDPEEREAFRSSLRRTSVRMLGPFPARRGQDGSPPVSDGPACPAPASLTEVACRAAARGAPTDG
jgi:DNA-binding MarR family transcriptional regulator